MVRVKVLQQKEILHGDREFIRPNPEMIGK